MIMHAKNAFHLLACVDTQRDSRNLMPLVETAGKSHIADYFFHCLNGVGEYTMLKGSPYVLLICSINISSPKFRMHTTQYCSVSEPSTAKSAIQMD
jgi:hypothetical protein